MTSFYYSTAVLDWAYLEAAHNNPFKLFEVQILNALDFERLSFMDNLSKNISIPNKKVWILYGKYKMVAFCLFCSVFECLLKMDYLSKSKQTPSIQNLKVFAT